MADPLLDFNRDIAPVRNNFGFTSSESAFLTSKADQEIMPQLDLMVKLRGQIQKERASELAYETSLFEFKQRKKDIRDQREADIKAEELLKPIEDIMKNDELSPFEQSEQIGIIQLNNPDAFANSKIAQQSLLAANRFLTSKMQQRNEDMAKKLRRRERRKEEERRADTTGFDINTIYKYREQEDIDALKDRYMEDNEISPREQANLDNAAMVVRDYKRQEGERKQKEELAERELISRQSMAASSNLVKQADDYLKRLEDLVEKAEEDPDNAASIYAELEGVRLADNTLLGTRRDEKGNVIESLSEATLRKQLGAAKGAAARRLREEQDQQIEDAKSRLRKLEAERRRFEENEGKNVPPPKESNEPNESNS
jgi:hypothetical protein